MWTSQVALVVKNPLPMQEMQETQAQSLGREDLLEKEIATHSSILAWEIPWIEEPQGLQFMGWQRVGHHWATEHAGRACVFVYVCMCVCLDNVGCYANKEKHSNSSYTPKEQLTIFVVQLNGGNETVLFKDFLCFLTAWLLPTNKSFLSIWSPLINTYLLIFYIPLFSMYLNTLVNPFTLLRFW